MTPDCYSGAATNGADCMQTKPLALLVAALAATPLPLTFAAAQVRDGWWPRQVDFNDVAAADQAIMRRNLLAAEQLMTRTSGYAKPSGFEAVAAWRVQASRGPRDAREYWVELGAYVPNREATGVAELSRTALGKRGETLIEKLLKLKLGRR